MVVAKKKKPIDVLREKGVVPSPKVTTITGPPPTEATKPPKTLQPKAKPPAVIRDEETGRISGVTVGGKTFLGLGKQDIEAVIRNQGPEPTPAGSVEASQVAQLQEQRETGARLARNVGQINPEIAGQPGIPLDVPQLVGAGVSGAAPGIVGGIATGAISGAVGGPIGVVAGAVIGGVATAISSVKGNLKSQQQGKIQAGAQGLKDGERNLRQLITAANKDPSGHPEYLALFNEQLSYIERDYGNLQTDTSGFLKDLSGADGTPQLADYARFYAPNGQRDYFIQQMQLALVNPDPNKNLISPEDALQ